MDGAPVYDRDNCPVERTLALLAGKWRLMVLFRLAPGPVRFNALVRSLAPVSRRVLTVTLRALEDDGLIVRRVRPGVLPHVEYALTARGAALGPVFEAMAQWHIGGAPAPRPPGRPDGRVPASAP